MKTIQDQLALEHKMLNIGAANYIKGNESAVEDGRGSEASYARKLMQNFVEPLIGDLNTWLYEQKAGQMGRVRPLLRQIDASKSVYFALKTVFNSLIEQQTAVQVAMDIARYVEDDIRFTKFQNAHKEYYGKILLDFKRKGTTDYRHMHRVLTHSANEMQVDWQGWTNIEKCEVGMRLLNLILCGTNIIQKRTIRISPMKTQTIIVATDETLDWIRKHEDFHKLLNPGRLPCIIPPDDWTSNRQGGYYSPEVRSVTPFLKTYDKAHDAMLAETNMAGIFDTVNKIQRTPWKVNTRVLEIVDQVWNNNLGIGMPGSEKLEPPPSPFKDMAKEDMTAEQKVALDEWKREASEVYTAERERRAKSFQAARVVRLAREYSEYENFWYVWVSDFRGRHYSATAGFSPQGPDLAKGLIRLGNSVELTERGWYWLRVHGANRYGYDKCNFAERAAWVDARHSEILAIASDPLSNRDLWTSADKPYQFLAFCFEYSEACDARLAGVPYFTHLPIGMDGSCNGLQNFSAMLLDEDGGRATNLVPQSVPADIYSAVARVCCDKLRSVDFHPIAQQWLEFASKYGKDGILPRSIAKRPVMTLPYGSTRQSCTQYIFQAIMDIDRDFFAASFAAAVWLTPLLWESIGDVVVAARTAMQWLQVSASTISKANEPIMWITPDGFPVFLSMKKIAKQSVITQLAGNFHYQLGNFTPDVDPRKQRTGVSPNFVHSIDASHLRETVRVGWEKGIEDWALIHDDYGTHASNIDALHEALRLAFVNTYRGGSPLATFKAMHEARGFTLKPLPPTGKLDIEKVKDSEFFFS